MICAFRFSISGFQAFLLLGKTCSTVLTLVSSLDSSKKLMCKVILHLLGPLVVSLPLFLREGVCTGFFFSSLVDFLGTCASSIFFSTNSFYFLKGCYYAIVSYGTSGVYALVCTIVTLIVGLSIAIGVGVSISV